MPRVRRKRRCQDEPRVMRRRFAASLCVIGLALPALAHHDTRQPSNHSLDGWAVAPFALTDQNGREFTQANLRGRWTFVLFGDTTACAQQCSAALAALVGLTQRIARADAMKTTQIVFISLDPERDTPARLREYLASFDSRFVGATGAPATVRGMADDMGTTVAAAPAGIDNASPRYRGSLLLIGPDATLRAEYLPPLDVQRLTASYLRARHGR